jgi:superoxide reductase
MAKEGGLYVCDICQQVVRVVKSGVGTLVCCGQPMRLFEEDEED